MAEKKPTYWELLRHPNWQKKRLEVMERAEFACKYCGATDKTLNVHHTYYEKGCAPWEYPTQSLHCLCEDCHKKAQLEMTLLNRLIGTLDTASLQQLIGYALGLQAAANPDTVVDVYSYEVAWGVADSAHVSTEEVLESLQDGVIDGFRLIVLTVLRERRHGFNPKCADCGRNGRQGHTNECRHAVKPRPPRKEPDGETSE